MNEPTAKQADEKKNALVVPKFSEMAPKKIFNINFFKN